MAKHNEAGEKIRIIRQYLGLTLRQLGESTDVHRSDLSKIERGVRSAYKPERQRLNSFFRPWKKTFFWPAPKRKRGRPRKEVDSP